MSSPSYVRLRNLRIPGFTKAFGPDPDRLDRARAYVRANGRVPAGITFTKGPWLTDGYEIWLAGIEAGLEHGEAWLDICAEAACMMQHHDPVVTGVTSSGRRMPVRMPMAKAGPMRPGTMFLARRIDTGKLFVLTAVGFEPAPSRYDGKEYSVKVLPIRNVRR